MVQSRFGGLYILAGLPKIGFPTYSASRANLS